MDAADLTPEQRARVAAFWWRRAAGEMTSWVGWQHVLEDLRAERSPDAVVALAERSVADELRHAIWCREWAERFGHDGGEIRPRSEVRFTLAGEPDAENRLARIALCCFTETVGCYTLQHARPAVRDPELRKLNQRHLADELQHSRTGWAHLSTLDAPQKETLRRLTPVLLEWLARICCVGSDEAAEELVPHGYFTLALNTRAHDDAKNGVILPGLRHLGVL